LTKPIGTGIIATATKKKAASEADEMILVKQLTKLNSIGFEMGKLKAVHSMTDVTGFGLLGHLIEMAEASKCTAILNYHHVPLMEDAHIHDYLSQSMIPGGSGRNFSSYGHKAQSITKEQQNLLCDPQTNGGLLIAIDPNFKMEFENILRSKGELVHCIGEMIEQKEKSVLID